jgi:hypothetical protein
MSRSSVPAKRPATDAQEAAWLADEDRFVLRQAKKKAVIRAKGGRAQPIDWLAATLVVIDPERNALDDEVDVEELDIKEPEAVLEELGEKELGDLEKGIDGYLALEDGRANVEYWQVSSCPPDTTPTYTNEACLDRPTDHEDNMCRAQETTTRSERDNNKRRQLSSRRSGQDAQAKVSGAAGDAGEADQDEAGQQ